MLQSVEVPIITLLHLNGPICIMKISTSASTNIVQLRKHFAFPLICAEIRKRLKAVGESEWI